MWYVGMCVQRPELNPVWDHLCKKFKGKLKLHNLYLKFRSNRNGIRDILFTHFFQPSLLESGKILCSDTGNDNSASLSESDTETSESESDDWEDAISSNDPQNPLNLPSVPFSIKLNFED